MAKKEIKEIRLRDIEVGGIVRVKLNGDDKAIARARYLGQRNSDQAPKLYWVQLLLGGQKVLVEAKNILPITPEKTLTVGQLRELTEGLDPNTQVIFRTFLGDGVPVLSARTDLAYRPKSETEGTIHPIAGDSSEMGLTAEEWEVAKSHPVVVLIARM